eukprot:TRINITY_DN11572_c0_g1_i3.p1 TRINITY_DN11572_c0_g1~~TRINITY_DN11572_c0_g1_i3.p1  ORF type:complete len:738 (+),score=101.42 TRINITY_DN11572_c0_g1_i3:2-2215(+)
MEAHTAWLAALLITICMILVQGSEITVNDDDIVFSLPHNKTVRIDQGLDSFDAIELFRRYIELERIVIDLQETVAQLQHRQANNTQALESRVSQVNESLSLKLDECSNSTEALQQQIESDKLRQGNVTEDLRNQVTLVNIGLQEQLTQAIADVTSQTNAKLINYASASTLDDITERVEAVEASKATREELANEAATLARQLDQVLLTQNSSLENDMLRCLEQGLIYNQSSAACEPAFIHDGCQMPPAMGVASCGADTSYKAVCDATCAAGYELNQQSTVAYTCSSLGQWEPSYVNDTISLPCVEIDECSSDPCGPGQTCSDLIADYTCACNDGSRWDRKTNRCIGAFFHWLDLPQRIRQAATVHCQKAMVDVDFLPAEATGIIASATTFNSCLGDHVVWGMGRDNSHSDCTSWSASFLVKDAYFTDVLLTQNGNSAGNRRYGTSTGTIIAPITADNKLAMSLSMGHSCGTNYLTLLVYGYITGDFAIPVDQVSNVFQSTTVQNDKRNAQPSFVQMPAAGLFATVNAYINADDHFEITNGRTYSVPIRGWEDAPYEGQDEYWGDVRLTHNGQYDTAKEVYGRSFGSSPCRHDQSQNNCLGRHSCRADADKPSLSSHQPEPCAAVPIGAKGLLTTIHTYANGHHDHVCHSFGRNAAHSDFVADNAPYTLPDEEAWLNDVLITSEGDDSVTYYYGYFHGTQLIPLKANGRFDAVLNLHRNSNSIGGTLHEIVLLVVGYIV